MQSGTMRDQKLLFTDSTINVQGNGTRFNLQFPMSRFSVDPPEHIRLNLHQFQMYKNFGNIHQHNRRFWLMVNNTNTPAEGNLIGVGWTFYPVDLLPAQSLKSDPDFSPMDIYDYYRSPYDDNSSAISGDKVSVYPVIYNVDTIPPVSPDFRTLLEYSINCALQRFNSVNPAISLPVVYDGVTYYTTKAFNPTTYPADPGLVNQLSCQVHWDVHTRKMGLRWVNLLPNDLPRYPTLAPAQYVPSGTIQPLFTQMKDMTQNIFDSVFLNPSFPLPAVPGNVNASAYTQFKSSRDSGVYNDSGELLGARSIRNIDGNWEDVVSFFGLPGAPGAGFLPNSWRPSDFRDFGLVTCRSTTLTSYYPVQIDTLNYINVHVLNVPGNNFKTIDFDANKNAVGQYEANPTTILARVPLPTKKFSTGSTGGVIPTTADNRSNSTWTGRGQLIGTEWFDKICYSALFPTIFGMTLQNPKVGNLQMVITDGKNRELPGAYDDIQAEQGNLSCCATICFHTSYNQKLPNPEGVPPVPATANPQNVVEGGIHNNTYLEQQAMLEGSRYTRGGAGNF